MPAFAGADRVAERLLESMPEHDYVIYVVRGRGSSAPFASNRRYVQVPALKGKHTRAISYFLLCSLHFVVSARVDVAHVHNSDFGAFCLLLKLKPRTRIVGTFHGTHAGPNEREKWGWLARAFLRLSEWFFVHSCDALTSVTPLSLRGQRVVEYIPNGADLWKPPQVPCKLPREVASFTRGTYIVFACGRLDGTKGLHHLLAAYREIPDKRRLLVIGNFAHDKSYSAVIEAEARLDSRVLLYRSLLERETLFHVIANSALFVFPSEFEAMSMMLLEAIACETLIVCSDIPENIAVVGDTYPLLFHSGDARDLANVMKRALDAPPDAREVRRLITRVQAKFSWSSVARQYDDLYRAV